MAKRNMFLGLDVHKDPINDCLAEEGQPGEGRRDGVIPGDLEALDKVVRLDLGSAPYSLIAATCR